MQVLNQSLLTGFGSDCDLEGLFEADTRKSYEDQTVQFKQQLVNVKKGSISTLLPNTYAACGALARYFTELDEPVVPLSALSQVDSDDGKEPTRRYAQLAEALQKLPQENQHLFAYMVNFCYRLQRKQRQLTPQLLGKALGWHIIRDERGEYSPRAVELFTLALLQYHDHFLQGTAVPEAPLVQTVSMYEDDDTPGGFIAVRVNNYQVTSLMRTILSTSLFPNLTGTVQL